MPPSPSGDQLRRQVLGFGCQNSRPHSNQRTDFWRRFRLALFDPKNALTAVSMVTNLAVSDKVRSIHIWETVMSWNKPKVKEVCIGMEINDYFPAEL